MRLIRHYNSLFCFTSLGVAVDTTVNVGPGPYAFKMGGGVYHRIGSLLPSVGSDPKFAPLYLVDSAGEVDSRLRVFDGESDDALSAGGQSCCAGAYSYA